MEDNIDMKNQFGTKNLPYPAKNRDSVFKSCVRSGLNDPIKIRNNAHVSFNGKNLKNVRFFKENSLTAVSQHLTREQYVDNAIDEPTKIRNIKKKDFNDHFLAKLTEITLS